ncbi:alpha/beta hydrolase [Bacilli bacterium]|nr:alpha/beta hydrolase [Bacilli bacterium]
MSEVVFKGTFGKIDGFYSHSRNASAPAVLVVGSNNEKPTRKGCSFGKTVNAVFDTFVENDFSVLRFDFVERVIDKNEIDNANILDMTVALDWLHNKNLECRSFWICGLDYGAFVGLQLVMRRPELENYVLISPNSRKLDLSFIIPCSACGLIVRGSEDVKFTEDECLALQEKLITKAESIVKCITVYKAERDFSSELRQFRGELATYLKEKTADDRRNIKHVTAGKRRRRKKKSAYQDEEKIVYANPVKALDIKDI